MKMQGSGTTTGGKSLMEVEALYGSLIETLPAIVYVAEPLPPYATIYTSPSIATLGYSLEEWMSEPCRWVGILHPDDRDRVLEQTDEAMRLRGENDYEYRVIARDGSVHWIHDRGRFVKDGEGRPICWQGVLLDITERKKVEEEREALILQLRKASAEIKALSSFIPICSYCKSVRDDRDYWQALDRYLTENSGTRFSHGICPQCYAKFVVPQLSGIMDPTSND